MAEVTTTALLLRRYDFGETSQIGHLLGAAEGRVSVLAKGIKKPNPRLKGPFDLFQWARVRYRRRAGSDLALLTFYEPLTGFRGLRSRLDRFYAAAYLCELVYELAPERHSQPDLLRAALAGLKALAGVPRGRSSSVLVASELQILEATGFRPDLDRCVGCGRPLRAESTRFSPRLGGFLGEECPTQGSSLQFCSAGSRAALAALWRAGPASAASLRLDRRQESELRSLFREHGREILERPLRSEPFVTDVRYGFPRLGTCASKLGP